MLLSKWILSVHMNNHSRGPFNESIFTAFKFQLASEDAELEVLIRVLKLEFCELVFFSSKELISLLENYVIIMRIKNIIKYV